VVAVSFSKPLNGGIHMVLLAAFVFLSLKP